MKDLLIALQKHLQLDFREELLSIIKYLLFFYRSLFQQETAQQALMAFLDLYRTIYPSDTSIRDEKSIADNKRNKITVYIDDQQGVEFRWNKMRLIGEGELCCIVQTSTLKLSSFANPRGSS